MNKIVSLGELIIDFTSVGHNGLKDTKEFIKNAGGAPANLCAQVAKLGGRAVYLSSVGNDGFGEFLIESLKKANIDTNYIKKSSEYDTSLAFVSLKEDGNREFKFYRKNAADLNFNVSDFENISFDEGDIFEFGSVALNSESSVLTHNYLIEKAKNSKAIIAFDPNIRLNLWSDHEALKDICISYIKKSNIVKISDDELPFITNILEESKAVDFIFSLGVDVLLLSRGSKGASLFLKNNKQINSTPYKVNCIDSTGAGDSFFGGFLYTILEQNVTVNNINEYQKFDYSLDFAARCGAYTTTGLGAIAAMGNLEEIKGMVK